MSDNTSYVHTEDGDLHPSETVEEKISLSERFGLWVSFYPFRQDDYLSIVHYWLKHFDVKADKTDKAETEAEALRWALQRGSRSGRVAWQFARDYAGKHAGKHTA
jgi:predicted AAA+ superfamily ATPase